jgi:hypothetical protein
MFANKAAAARKKYSLLFFHAMPAGGLKTRFKVYQYACLFSELISEKGLKILNTNILAITCTKLKHEI